MQDHPTPLTTTERRVLWALYLVTLTEAAFVAGAALAIMGGLL